MKKAWNLLLICIRMFFELLWAFGTFYVLVYLSFSLFSVPKEQTNELPTETILLSHHGIHTDVILPIRHPLKNWETTLGLSHLLVVDTFQTHLKFGWGDKNFFLRTKEWSDLEVNTVVGTVFGRGPGAMHLVLCTPKDIDKSTFIELKLTPKQYQRLCAFIHHSFAFEGKIAKEIKTHPYGSYDFFFDSSIDYNMTYTCNTWTNNALKRAGQKACVWTPFKGAILSKYTSVFVNE